VFCSRSTAAKHNELLSASNDIPPPKWNTPDMTFHKKNLKHNPTFTSLLCKAIFAVEPGMSERLMYLSTRPNSMIHGWSFEEIQLVHHCEQ
jgi:hypothetical protein